MIGVEDLLKEASEQPPCGPDMSADLAFVQVHQLAQGKPERGLGNSVTPAEPPPWSEVSERTRALLARSKDLRLAMLLARAEVALDGLPGLANGLQLIHGLLDRYWDNLHPSLDPDDADATERMNALAEFSDRSDGYTPTGLQEVRRAAVFRSRRLGQASIRDIEIGLGRLKGAKDPGVSQQEVLQWAGVAAKDDPESYNAARNALKAARRAHALSLAVEKLLSERSKGRQSPGSPLPTFTALRQILDAALAFEREFGGTAPTIAETSSSPQTLASLAQQEPQAVQRAAASETIRSREDAVKLLDLVCQFLERTEPANPAPLLIQRGKRLITMSFVDIVKDLAPDSLAQIEKVSGQKLTK